MPPKKSKKTLVIENAAVLGSNFASDIEELTYITVNGAREHNLKNVHLTIPRDKLVVITGLSGSGKSSLAFDTLYAEGQRRYVECLSPYARQFLGLLKKPDVDVIEGLSPAISIEQKSVSHNPRSTVGTVTEIYDFLRLLYAKVGRQYCVNCNIPVRQQTTDQIIENIYHLPEGTKVQIMAPVVRGRKGHYRELFEQLRRQGFTRVRVDGELQELHDGMQVSRYKIHNIELVIDRTTVSKGNERRIHESVETALNRGDNKMMLLSEEGSETVEKFYSTDYSCPSCGRSYEPLAPNMFSFNSPFGACPSCEGLGEIKDFDPRLMIPSPSLSIADGGIAPLGKKRSTWLWKQVESAAKFLKIDTKTPISELEPEKVEMILKGNEDATISVVHTFASGQQTTYTQRYEGITKSLRHQYEQTGSSSIRKTLEAYMSTIPCGTCGGGRLKIENLFVRLGEKNIHNVTQQDISESVEFFKTLPAELTPREMKIANLILKEIVSRLGFLSEVGLDYLAMNRAVRTLSGGESQRIRLASQIGSQLVGVLYVLDEPSIGLHQHDNYKLIASLKHLRDIGNSVIVVEHDREMIEQADFVVDMGPRAGVHGGEVMIATEPENFKNLTAEELENSLTLQYLNSTREVAYPDVRRPGNGKFLKLEGATGHNLHNVDLNIPLGTFTCITGMSGSGKSTLMNDTLYPILARYFYNSTAVPLPYRQIAGLEHIDKVIEIDQTPIGRTPRSNPATYTGLFTNVRDFFTMLPEAKIRGYKAGRFSFNVAGGRCEGCEGAGIKKIEMNFLPDVYVPCDTCGGKRYNKETQLVHYKGKSIADVLEMTIEEAVEFFGEIPKLRNKLQTIYEVGLGYIRLGQQAPTLSGGEAQRIKLATELSKVQTGKTLYLLDEPTTGLHFEDINILLKLLNRLVEKGNTVVVIEHNLDVVKCADWIVDLGPQGGKFGGRIVAEGTPEHVVTVPESLTGKYLKVELER
ncbi:MAG: excinuclease ABC subunit UvrA [Bacteroidota bacterium]